MRYESWDVILFPADTHIPIQEFKTVCYATQDEYGRRLPILTCYVSSLPAATPFRISVHSWTKPKPTALIESKRKPNQRVVYTVRILIDGVRIFYDYFEASHNWPQEIKQEKRWIDTPFSHIDQQDPTLQFPPFRPDVLMQSLWHFEEDRGRIKVVVSEQLMSQADPGDDFEFGFSNDIVCFSFQHAPKDYLEQAGICWPLPNPPYAAAPGPFGINPPRQAHKGRSVRNNHHSPPFHQLPKERHAEPTPKFRNEPFPKFDALPKPPNASLQDPFMDPFADVRMFDGWDSHHGSNSASDIMTDFNPTSPLSSRQPNSRSSHGVGRQVVMTLRDDQFGRLIEALSPQKHYCLNQMPPPYPLPPPAPMTSNGIPTSAPLISKPSAAAMARNASYPNISVSDSRTVLKHSTQDKNMNGSPFLMPSAEIRNELRQIQPQSRYSPWPSDISMRDPASAGSSFSRLDKRDDVPMKSSPATTTIRSRKEGRMLQDENMRPVSGHMRGGGHEGSMGRLERELFTAITTELSGMQEQERDVVGKRKREGDDLMGLESTPESKVQRSERVGKVVMHEISDD